MSSKKIKRAHKAKARPQKTSLRNGAAAAAGVGTGKSYSPRPGTVPDWIYRNLAERPMLFGELSVHVGQATGMSGDNLASQLSASLRDLVVRGAIVRLHHDTKKPVPGKNARGALYSLVPTAKAAYLTAKKGVRAHRGLPLPPIEVFSGAPAPDPDGNPPRQLDLGSFAPGDRRRPGGGVVSVDNKPARMPMTMYAELTRAQGAARAQLQAIEAILRDPAWT